MPQCTCVTKCKNLEALLQIRMLMGASGSAQSAEPGQLIDFLWEEAAVSTWPGWQAMMCGLGRQKGCLVWGRSRGALASGCLMLGSA